MRKKYVIGILSVVLLILDCWLQAFLMDMLAWGGSLFR